MGSHLPRALLVDNDTLSRAGPSTAPAPFHSPLSTRPYAGMLFRPTVVIIVVALTTILSLTCLLLLYAKNCRRHAATSSSGMPSYGAAPEQRSSGVERSVVESLPFFRFGSLQGEKEGAECAVCLGRFEVAELLRLLPKCRHAFHVDCVDAWLESHSTCPFCRSRVKPEDVLLLSGGPDDRLQPSPPPPARRISGRHSSVGEESSGTAVRIAVRRSSESGGPAAGGKQRKDGLLLPANHRVVFAGGEGVQERWSDLRPADLMFLQLEGRGVASGISGRIGTRRSASEVILARLPPEEERTTRKWLGFAAVRTARWPGGSQYSGG